MREDDETEFKRVLTKESMKSVVAFLNTRGGTIYYGISDDGTAYGVDQDETSRNAATMISDTIRPDPREFIRITSFSMDGKDIVQVSVSPGTDRPYYLREKGLRAEGVFVRIGSCSLQATESMVRRMVKDFAVTAYESVLSTEQDLTFEATSRIFKREGVAFGEKQMVTLGMVKGGAYTNLAYFMSDQCRLGIKVARFKGVVRDEFLNRREFSGSVIAQFDAACEYIELNDDRWSKIVGLKRIDGRAFPVRAVREALVNAIVHRDYSINGPTLVSIFDDSMTIVSLGGLVPDIGLEEIKAGVSSTRNPCLADIFYRLHYIEAYGTGVPRMFLEYRGTSCEPEISATTNSFKVTLPRLSPPEDDEQDGGKVMSMFLSADYVTRADVEKALGVSKTKANSMLASLVASGRIEKVGGGRSVRYTLKTNRRIDRIRPRRERIARTKKVE